ncbi:sensor histidine kinase [Telmatobacter bradus]|uniref:sensor histidine kinase n=1 Tax=Telmatobacter bradus TaxID=474953 RepID=UPI003B43A83B
MQTQAARTSIAKQRYEQADQRLERIVQVVKEAHLGMRESITGLQTVVSDKRDFLQALETQLEWYRRHCEIEAGLEVRCAWAAEMLSPVMEAQALRIIQEALSNVRKYAQARRVRVVLSQEAQTQKFLVEDDGCGFDTEQSQGLTGHHGLAIMRERAEEIGAQLVIDSQPGTGTRICLQLTIPVENAQTVSLSSEDATQ